MRFPQRLRCYCFLALTSAIMCFWLSSPTQGQTSSTATIPSDDVKEAHIYRLLFRQSLTYKRLADEAEAHGEPKPYFRRIVANRLELDDYDAASLLRLSLAYEAEIAPIRKQIDAVKKAFLAKFPFGYRYPGMDVTQPAEMGELRAREDAITIRYRDLLRNELSSAVFENVDRIMRATYAGFDGQPQTVR